MIKISQKSFVNIDQIVQNQALIGYFKVKFNFFEENIYEAIPIIENEIVLTKTFRKMQQKYELKMKLNLKINLQNEHHKSNLG